MPADEKEPFSAISQMLPIGDVADEAQGDTQGPWWCYHNHGHTLRHDPSTWAPRPKPHPQPDLFPGARNVLFFNLRDLASASLGPYLHILQELCWLPVSPHALGPAGTMLQPRRGSGERQPPRRELGLSPA